jgi:hypothetical protein
LANRPHLTVFDKHRFLQPLKLLLTGNVTPLPVKLGSSTKMLDGIVDQPRPFRLRRERAGYSNVDRDHLAYSSVIFVLTDSHHRFALRPIENGCA